MRTINYYFTVAATIVIAMLSSCDNTAYIVLPTDFKLESPTTVVFSANTLNGHEFIDLGLSVKWATCNIDAQYPEEFGEYYAWGDNLPYSHIAHILDSIGIHRENVIPRSASYDFKSMCTLNAVGRGLIKKGVDIASYNWGAGWRMPSYDEFNELYDNCTWQEVVINDVACFKGTSKVPGYTDRSIILPNTGLHFVDNETDYSEDGTYWTGTIHHYDMINLFVFNSKERFECYSGAAVGYPVRPVCK